MNILQSFKKNFNLFLEYAEFFAIKPRINRTKYLSLHLFYISMGFIGFILLVLHAPNQTYLVTFFSTFLFFFGAFLFILSLIGDICCAIRRIHDFNYKGWWLFLPIVNIVFSFLLLFNPGTIGQNRFGAEPKPASQAMRIVMIAAPIITFVINIILIIVLKK